MLKKFRKRESRKRFLIFQETETPKKILIFQETEAPKKLSYSRKWNFLYFGQDIFRTLTYSEPWHIQNPRHMQNTFKYLQWNVLQK